MEWVYSQFFERGHEKLPWRDFYSLDFWDYDIYNKPIDKLDDDHQIVDIWYRLQTR